jgi:hypothetical protein
MDLARRAAAALGVALLLIVGVADSGFAQLTRGAISGTIRDNTGAVLPGVTLTIRNNDTGITRTVVTDAAGFYRAGGLEPGTYTVSVQLQGFKTTENREVPVRPTGEATFDVVMELGGLAESIDVTAQTEAVTLNKTNATVGLVADSRQATLLPLGAGRSLNNLALLAPNVSNTGGPSNANNQVGATNISANGQRSRNNNFMIDGTDNNDVSVTIPTMPLPPESVAEVSVQTNPYNVEFGRNSGAQINIITKGGSNTFRGSAFEYYRDSELNARDNIEKAAGRDKPTPFTRHQWGGGLGGPIVRNKAFFYGLFQNDRTRQDALGATVRVPTPAGFAALQNVPPGANQTAASRQAVLQRLGFLQEVHAQNPAYRNLLTQNVNGTPIETAQINVSRTQPQDSWYYIGRGDVQLSSSDNLTARYVRNAPETTNFTSNTQFGQIFAANQLIVDQNFAASHTRVLGATSLNESRFAWIRRDLGFPENDPTSPTATIAGLFTIGGLANFPQGRVQDTYQFQNITTFQRGRHSLKAGADIRYINLDNQAAFDSKGTFVFNNLQDYMNNLAATFSQALQTSSFEATQWTQAYFVQDDFRPTSNLTLNLGLRYEYNTVPLGLFGAEEDFVRAALVPGPARDDKNNIAPRVGFAWSPTPRQGLARWLFGETTSSIRGGYGITYDVLFYNILTVNGSNYPRVVVPTLQNVQNVYPNLLPVTGQAVFNPLATFVNSPENIQSPMNHMWSLSWQREVARQYVVEVGYTGALGRYGIAQGQGNPAVLTDAQIATVQATRSATSVPSVQARRVFPQYGSRVFIQATAESEYNAVYFSVNRRFSRGLQFGAAYTYSALYSDGDESLGVASIALSSPQVPQDYNNLAAEWSRSAFDRPHRLVVNWIYEVPWFQGGWAQNAIVRTAFSGWQFAGIAQFSAGRPFTILTGVDSNGNGGGGDRPNLGSGRLVPDPVTGNFRTFTNEGAYVTFLGTNNLPLQNGLGNGNAPRNGLRGPGFQNWDLSLSKRFRTFGDQSLLVRADVLNAFNQDEYGNPVSNMNSPDFGRNTNNWGNRSITLGVSYAF